MDRGERGSSRVAPLARHYAALHASQFAEQLRQVLAEAASLLDAHQTTDSDAWEKIDRRLHHACQRMQSASYCLHEWTEPDDSQPDTIPDTKIGLRSIQTLAAD